MMSRVIFAISLMVCTCLIPFQTTFGMTFYVSPDGDDVNSGTLAEPFKTIGRARNAVRQYNSNMENDIQIVLRGGVYSILETISLDSRDSGSNGHSVIIRSHEGEEAVLSGALRVTGWEKHEGNIYKASFNSTRKLRTLVVNGQRAYMANHSIKGQGEWGEYVIRQGMAKWALISGTKPAGIKYLKQDLPDLRNPRDVEVLCISTWNAHIIGARSIGTSGTHRILKLQQPAGAIAFNQGWRPFYAHNQHTLSNAYEFLDEPGEFYFDRKLKTLYYYARPGEDMQAAEVFAPQLETLITIQGESRRARVQNLVFQGITFAHTESVLPRIGNSEVKTTVQAATWCVAFDDSNWHKDKYRSYDTMPNAVTVNFAESIRFENNTFKHIGNEAIGFINDVINAQFVGNLVYDVGGGAIQVGHPQHVYIGDKHRLAVFPGKREGVCKNILIENNVLYDMTKLFYGHAAITAYFADTLTMVKNHIQDTNYTAVSMGWGWNNFDEVSVPGNPTTTCRNNTFNQNRVYNCMKLLHDGGAFYTLGSQPGSEASGNYVKADSTNFQGIYHPDEGTAGYRGRDLVFEVVPGQDNFELNKLRRKQNIYYDNVYSTSSSQQMGAPDTDVTNLHVIPDADWPDEALSIIRAAGPDPEYHHLLRVIPNIVFSADKRYDTAESVLDNVLRDETPLNGKRYEAELAQLSGGAEIKSNRRGFKGQGFVDGFYNSDTSTVTFNVSVEVAGTYITTLRYAAGHGDVTNLIIEVNGQASPPTKLKSTGGWEAWATHTQSLLLQPGDNQVTLKTSSRSRDNFNLDFIHIHE